MDITSVVSTSAETRPVLVGFASGDSADMMEQLPDETVLQIANQSLCASAVSIIGPIDS